MAYHYATNITSQDGYIPAFFGNLDYEDDGNYANAIGEPNGDWFRITAVSHASAYPYPYSLLIFADFGSQMTGADVDIELYGRATIPEVEIHPSYPYVKGRVYGSNNAAAWGDYTHASWTQVFAASSNWHTGWIIQNWNDWSWTGANGVVGVTTDHRYFLFVRQYGFTVDLVDQYIDIQSIRLNIHGEPEPDTGYDLTPTGGDGVPPQGLACDGNGDGLYVAIYNDSGNPVLIKTGLPLHWSHNGSRIFNPGAGDAINVKCSEFLGDYVIISGKFAANNDTCRLSDDGGTTLTDIDGDWGTDRSQPIGLDPNDDDHILLPIDGATDDLEETEDASTWTTLDDALPFDVSSIAVFDLDPDELFIGNVSAAASLVQYSPNNGGTWSDITGALDVTGGIANIEVI